MILRSHDMCIFTIATHSSEAAVDVYEATRIYSALIRNLYLIKFEKLIFYFCCVLYIGWFDCTTQGSNLWQ